MKKTIKVTRKQVIDAIRLEPLFPGQWCISVNRPSKGWDNPALKKDCQVCAVGGVIRRSLRKPTVRSVNEVVEFNMNWGLDYTGDHDLEYAADLVKYNPWNALSCAFEYLSKKDDDIEETVSNKIREELVQWVKKYFPKTVELVTSKQ